MKASRRRRALEDTVTNLVDEFSRNLAEHRRRRRLSQEQLAARARISVSYVSMLERGIRSPPLATLAKLASAIGVSPLALLAPEMRRQD